MVLVSVVLLNVLVVVAVFAVAIVVVFVVVFRDSTFRISLLAEPNYVSPRNRVNRTSLDNCR